ncbi:MAG: hypothetical protein WCY93_10695 [Anaerolineaceae bacterium]
MTLCRIEEQDAGRDIPRTCPTCGLSGKCHRGLDLEGARIQAASYKEELEKLIDIIKGRINQNEQMLMVSKQEKNRSKKWVHRREGAVEELKHILHLYERNL